MIRPVQPSESSCDTNRHQPSPTRGFRKSTHDRSVNGADEDEHPVERQTEDHELDAAVERKALRRRAAIHARSNRLVVVIPHEELDCKEEVDAYRHCSQGGRRVSDSVREMLRRRASITELEDNTAEHDVSSLRNVI